MLVFYQWKPFNNTAGCSLVNANVLLGVCFKLLKNEYFMLFYLAIRLLFSVFWSYAQSIFDAGLFFSSDRAGWFKLSVWSLVTCVANSATNSDFTGLLIIIFVILLKYGYRSGQGVCCLPVGMHLKFTESARRWRSLPYNLIMNGRLLLQFWQC